MVTLRRTKGAPLTHDEMDNNFAEIAGKVNSANPSSSGTLTHTGSAKILGAWNILSGVAPWFDVGSSGPASSYGVFRRGVDGSAAGYLGTDGGGISSAGTGTGFGIRSEGKLLLGSNQLNQQVTLDSNGLLINVAAPIGYGIGSGGTAIQPTNKSTAITINKPNGIITTHNETLAAGASVFFAVFNSTYKRGDGVLLTLNDGSQGNQMDAHVWYGVDGRFYINLKNTSAAPQSIAVELLFQVIKGASS